MTSHVVTEFNNEAAVELQLQSRYL